MSNEPHLWTFKVDVLTELKGPKFSSVSEAIKNLKSHPITSTADDNGSITVWHNDKGYQCSRCVRMCEVSKAYVTTIKGLRLWLNQQLPLIY